LSRQYASIAGVISKWIPCVIIFTSDPVAARVRTAVRRVARRAHARGGASHLGAKSADDDVMESMNDERWGVARGRYDRCDAMGMDANVCRDGSRCA
jgi:hypothetical protein